ASGHRHHGQCGTSSPYRSVTGRTFGCHGERYCRPYPTASNSCGRIDQSHHGSCRGNHGSRASHSRISRPPTVWADSGCERRTGILPWAEAAPAPRRDGCAAGRVIYLSVAASNNPAASYHHVAIIENSSLSGSDRSLRLLEGHAHLVLPRPLH